MTQRQKIINIIFTLVFMAMLIGRVSVTDEQLGFALNLGISILLLGYIVFWFKMSYVKYRNQEITLKNLKSTTIITILMYVVLLILIFL